MSAQLANKDHVRASALVQVAHDFDGEAFTDSFDVRSRRLGGVEKEHRKRKRLTCLLKTETSEKVNLHASHRRKCMIKRRVAYGTLLGKNAYALLTLVVGSTGGLKLEDGVLPGPGAQSGHRFVTGHSLGIGGASSSRGLLADEFDETLVTYKKLRLNWLELVREYKQNASDATSVDEQLFWTRLSRRLAAWREADDIRTQFRLCEFSKIAGIICRKQGRYRKGHCSKKQRTLLVTSWTRIARSITLARKSRSTQKLSSKGSWRGSRLTRKMLLPLRLRPRAEAEKFKDAFS